MSKPKKARTVILTASIAMITATGAWYGAGLKTRQELKKVCSLGINGLLVFYSYFIDMNLMYNRTSEQREKLHQLKSLRIWKNLEVA